jgi:prolyl oligopeptidase
MLEIARSEGHRGDLRSFLDRMREDPRFRPKTRDEILDRYRAICARMDGALPRAFGRLPKVGYEVRAIEEFREKDSPAAFYQPPPDDRTRPGYFYANTCNPSQWPTYDYEALCFHEAVPGHHLQIALAQETTGLPSFRRHGGFTAYVEGWAHYTERLADEMGMYSGPYDRLGMLSAQAWRAARLVVDTGLHRLRWTRAQAIELMESVRSGPKSDVENEVDRYIIWPGQALAYKVGSRTITEIRERTKRRLGARFDLRGFHDLVLAEGALPLSILAETVDRWQGAKA